VIRNALEDFQTRPHLPPRTDDLLVFVTIRELRHAGLARISGLGRMATVDSVRVEFESSRRISLSRLSNNIRSPC